MPQRPCQSTRTVLSVPELCSWYVAKVIPTPLVSSWECRRNLARYLYSEAFVILVSLRREAHNNRQRRWLRYEIRKFPHADMHVRNHIFVDLARASSTDCRARYCADAGCPSTLCATGTTSRNHPCISRAAASTE